MKTQAVFMGMEYYNPMECEVTKVVVLSDEDYDYFRNHLYQKYDFLQRNQEYMARMGTTPRCLLVMGEHTRDGILVDGDRTGRACHTAHFPEAAAYVQAHAEELTEDLAARRMLTQDDVIIMEAQHILNQYGRDGGMLADFSDCYLSALDFHDTQFNKAIFRGALLEDCDLTGAGMCSCDFTGATFVRCNAQNLSAEEAIFVRATIVDCDFLDARLTHSDLRDIHIEDSNFFGVNLDHCITESSHQLEEECKQQCCAAPVGKNQGRGPDECWDEDHICPSCLAAMGGL